MHVLLFIVLHLILQFESSRDAENAIRGRDGYVFDGHRLRVKFLPVSVHVNRPQTILHFLSTP